jgi:hypothetical protein
MDWHILLLFVLYVACLLGIFILLLFVASKHNKPERSTNFGETPARGFRLQEVLSLLTWVGGLCTTDNTQTTDHL